ncbi:Rcr2/Rcr1 [Kluyveromyces lactis]|nr:Rcr2/Rcr1 [Kluyveromyces lactis]
MPVLDKRIYYYSSGSSWTWGRWILFALLIVGLAALIFGTNVRRRRRGAQPIVGTSWLAPPPSYGQAAAQNNNYNPNNPQMSQQPLPLYTENVNQNDMGYYDSEVVYYILQLGLQFFHASSFLLFTQFPSAFSFHLESRDNPNYLNARAKKG